MTTAENITARRPPLARVQDELEALETMGIPALRAKYETVFGEETHSRNAPYLRRKIAWRIQEIAEGGLTDRARTRIEELAVDAPIRHCPPRAPKTERPVQDAEPSRDERIPPIGTVLVKSHKGADHRVAVTSNGFIYESKTYRSLSAVARVITGTTWNGYTFFANARRIGRTS